MVDGDHATRRVLGRLGKVASCHIQRKELDREAIRDTKGEDKGGLQQHKLMGK